MHVLQIDASGGATASALLGALVELGASLTSIEQAVRALGPGDVAMTVQDGRTGSTVRVRAPRDAPYRDLWGDMRPRVALLPLPPGVVADTLRVLDRLFAARAAVHAVPVEDVDVDPFTGLDDLASAVGIAAAIADVGPFEVRWTGPVGVGSGVVRTMEGDVPMPGPVVAHLLADVPCTSIDRPLELVDPIAAAALTTVLADGATAGDTDAADPAAHQPTGRGRLPGGLTLQAHLRPSAAGQPCCTASAGTSRVRSTAPVTRRPSAVNEPTA